MVKIVFHLNSQKYFDVKTVDVRYLFLINFFLLMSLKYFIRFLYFIFYSVTNVFSTIRNNIKIM